MGQFCQVCTRKDRRLDRHFSSEKLLLKNSSWLSTLWYKNHGPVTFPTISLHHLLNKDCFPSSAIYKYFCAKVQTHQNLSLDDFTNIHVDKDCKHGQKLQMAELKKKTKKRLWTTIKTGALFWGHFKDRYEIHYVLCFIGWPNLQCISLGNFYISPPHYIVSF